jgi:hypothetical protein
VSEVEARFVELNLLGPRGELLKVVKAQVSSVVLSQDPIEVESKVGGWRRFEPSRFTQWSFHLMEDTKREEETEFCGDSKAHSFHRFADRFWCDGYNAEQQAAVTMVNIVVDQLVAEKIPSETIDRIKRRLIFGHPEGGQWISEVKVAEAFAADLIHREQLRRLYGGDWTQKSGIPSELKEDEQ